MNSSAILSHPIKPITASEPIDKDLAEAFLSSMMQYRKELQGRRIWLACSGGRDSLVLATLCLQLYQQGKLPFLPQLLHVDHGLQADSSHWAVHVSKWAQAQQLPCYILKATVDGHDEQAARQARYQIMLSHLNQDDVLLLAHHADDQAETVLMRLIQGAGVKGLSGMQPWRIQTQGVRRHILWRPWLTVRRSNISAHAESLKLPYIDDPTNDSGDNVRSGLRGDIMPALAVYNPNVIDNIARSAQLLADAEATVSAQAIQDLQQTTITVLQLPPAQRVLSILKLQMLPRYRQRQLLHHWLAQDEPLPPTKQLVDEVLNLSQRHDQDHQTALFWQGRRHAYRIRRYRQQLYRLNDKYLKWLKISLVEQTYTLSNSVSLVTNLIKSQPVSITMRDNQDLSWQVQFMANELLQLLEATVSQPILKPILKITALNRKQRIQTALATRPQAGKKLYQTLGVPSWLRESLAVVSVVFINAENELPIELPLLLLSPFERWLLNDDKSAIEVNTKNKQLAETIESHLILNEKL